MFWVLIGIVLIIVLGFALFYLMPHTVARYFVYFIIARFYHIHVDGVQHIPDSGGVLLVGNHASYLDWAIIQITCPRPVRFVMQRSIYHKWYLKLLFRILQIIPISQSGSKQAMTAIREALLAGDVVCLFPEGRLSRNGQMGKFHSGFQHILHAINAALIPFYLRGLWGGVFSRAPHDYHRATNEMRHINMVYGAKLPQPIIAAELKQQITRLSIQAWQNYANSLNTIAIEWLRSAKQMPRALAVVDSTGVELSYQRLLTAVWQLSTMLKPSIKYQQNIGIMLPPSAGGIMANLAVLCLGKTVVNLNYTATKKQLFYAIKLANIKTIITADQFLEKLKQRGVVLDDVLATVTIIKLNHVRERMSRVALLGKLIAVVVTPAWLLRRFMLQAQSTQQVAAIKFSSGSEGDPKGVMLSHRNILVNAKQVISVGHINHKDGIMACLPLFHAFGFTVNFIMPLLQGAVVVCHPDPTDVVTVAKLIFQYQATMFCGTSTFFNLYVRNTRVEPLMLQSIRLCIAGAEKLATRTRHAFKEKFNIDILEGYGATELSPVVGSNLPDEMSAEDWHTQQSNKPGSIGMPLPGTAVRIVDPETYAELAIGEEGMVLVGGPQVMQGYLHNAKKTAAVLHRQYDITWYETGDKGYLDEAGFLTIIDRYSRFVKISGEMISLLAVENALVDILGDGVEVMALAQADSKKGERIAVLFVGDCSEKQLKSRLRAAKLNPRYQPSSCHKLEELPKLTSGKADYQAAKRLIIGD